VLCVFVCCWVNDHIWICNTIILYALGRRVITSTINGVNGTIFAYGQTSSGKTYTMKGIDIHSPDNPDNPHNACSDISSTMHSYDNANNPNYDRYGLASDR